MAQFKLPADASRILFVRHLPDAISHDELYELFGRFGAIEQIRLYVIEARKSSKFDFWNDLSIFELCDFLTILSLH